MPITFLNSFERQRYQEIPQDIQEDVIIRFFYLAEKDMDFVKSFYSVVNRTAVSILIGLIRYLGYVPDNWKDRLPASIFDFVSGQLPHNIPFVVLANYGKRQQTETEHLGKILAHLNFRKWQPLFDVHVVEKWLVEKGMVHDRERYLLDLLCQKLYSEKILRPSTGTLEDIVGRIREKLEKETYARLSFLWTTSLFEKLDKILEPDPQMRITPHRWLCNIPGGNTSVNI
jgi:hypothetical protein